jgi:ribosomal subunit interface protein
MILIKFKNLEKSDLVKEIVENRIHPLVEKFPDLSESNIQVTLEMENSRIQAGPDLFKVKLYIAKGRYREIAVEKKNSNLYVALAEITDHMLERLNRFGDKVRVKERATARKFYETVQKEGDSLNSIESHSE